MLSDKSRETLKRLMEMSIGGVVLKNDLKDWLVNIQNQKKHYMNSCEIKDLLNIAKELGIKVVMNKAEYNKICHKYKCFYSIPSVKEVEKKKKEERTEISNANPEIIEKMYHKEGKSAAEICSIYQIGTQTLYKYLRENNIKLKLNVERNRGKLTPKDIPICQELKKQGKTYKEIAELYGVTRQYMQEKLQKKKFDIYKENARLNKELKEKENEIERLKEMLNLKEAI